MDDFLPVGYQLPDSFVTTPPDFLTHKHYLDCLSGLSSGLSLTYHKNVRSKITFSKTLSKKTGLIKLTKLSLDSEDRQITGTPDFSQVCVSWVSVKSYYLLFNMILVLKYLITGEEIAFNTTHRNLLKEFTAYIKSVELVFSVQPFNDVRQAVNIAKWKATSGANIRSTSFNLDERLSQIFKKLYDYDIEEFKRTQKIINIRRKSDKQKVLVYITGLEVSLIAFFYWYRIKANYRDLEFIDNGANTNQLANYYHSYYRLTTAFYEALKALINKLAMIRFGRNIID